MSIKEILMCAITVSRLLVVVLANFGIVHGLMPPAQAQQPTPAQSQRSEQVAGLPKPLGEQDAALARQAASTALSRFSAAVSESNFRSLGFNSVAEAKAATAGSPIQTAYVGIDQLAAYVAGQPAAPLIRQGGLIVPMLVGDQFRCAVSIVSNAGTFRGVSLGRPHMTRLEIQSLQAVSREHNTPLGTLVVLRIPALYMTFIARSVGAQIWLTPVTAAPKSGLPLGQELRAEDVFARLRSVAQNQHGSNLAGLKH